MNISDEQPDARGIGRPESYLIPEVLFPQARADQQLTAGWGRTVALGWALTLFALISVGGSSQVIGRPVFWLDDQRFNTITLAIFSILACVPALATSILAILRGPRVGYLSLFASVDIFIVAAIDRHNSPGSALVTVALAAAGVLLTVASFAGRYRPSSTANSVTTSN